MECVYNSSNPLRVFTAFSGYDSQMMALQRLKDNFPDFDFVCVGWSEIDKNAIIAHDACFPECKGMNYGDISKIDWSKVPDFDLFTYSFPCTDISASGRQAGLEEGSGTRSSLLWECRKAIVAKHPRYLLMENVKALASGKFVKYLNKWQAFLHNEGYDNFTQILNAKDYGVPQNRERVFMVSILRTEQEPNPCYYFPKPFKLEKRIKDVLEQDVDESFFLSDKALEYFCRVNNDKTHNHNFQPKEGGYCVYSNMQEWPESGRQLYKGAARGRVNNSQDGVVSDIENVSPTLTAGHANQPKIIF